MKKIVALLLALVCLSAVLYAQQRRPEFNDGESHGDPPFLVEEGWKPLLNGRDLSGWTGQDGKPHEWLSTTGIWWERLLGPTKLGAVKEPGDRILNSLGGRTANLVSEEKFGDVELYLEFLLARGSNSGVYLQGLYEVQIFDSFDSAMAMKTSDGGAIYHQWIENKGVGGSPPKVNASRRPGEWQTYQIWFRAPRFTGGKKTENARFLRVLHNGALVQESFDVEGPTRAHMNIPEAPVNPLMLQGDHGPVAFRNIYVRNLRPIINR